MLYTIQNSIKLNILGLTWLSLLIIKVINGVWLYSKSVDNIVRYRTLQEEAEYELYRKRMLASKSKSAPNSPRLSLIDFTGKLLLQ